MSLNKEDAMSALALKPTNTDCYTSNRVFDGVRHKTANDAASHIARVKRILAARSQAGKKT